MSYKIIPTETFKTQVRTGASAVSDQDEFYMYLWLFLSRNSEKQHYSQPKSRSIASYWQQKSCWSETADAPGKNFSTKRAIHAAGCMSGH